MRLLPRKDALEPKKINLKNIWNYLRAMFRYFYNLPFRLRKKLGYKVEDVFDVKKLSTQEYIDYVVNQRIEGVKANSPVCLTKGYCIHCGCDFPEKFYEQDECKYGCYGAWPEQAKL